MSRSVLALLGAVVVCLHASSTSLWAQAAPAVPAAGGELVPFWLVIPAYPPIAQAARFRGVVVVALTVAADGRVQSATIEQDVPLLSHDVLACARDSGLHLSRLHRSAELPADVRLPVCRLHRAGRGGARGHHVDVRHAAYRRPAAGPRHGHQRTSGEVRPAA